MKLREMLDFATENYRFRIKNLSEAKPDSDIHFCRIMQPGQKEFLQHCLYLGYAAEFPEAFSIAEDTENEAVISFILAKNEFQETDLRPCTSANIYLIPDTDSVNELYDSLTEMIIDDGKLSGIMNRLFNALYRNEGLQSIVSAAADIFENSMLINDVAYNIIAKSSRTPLGRQILENAAGNGFIDAYIISEMRDQNIFERLHYSGKLIRSHQFSSNTDWLFRTVRINHTSIADIAIVSDNRPFRYIDYKLIELLSKMISLEMQKDEYFKNNRNADYSYFIQDLIEGNLNKEEVIQQRASMLGFRLYGSYWFAVAKTTFVSENHEELQYIKNQLTQILPEGKWIIYNHMIVALFSRPDQKQLTPYEYDKLFHFSNENHLSIGISDLFYRASEISAHFDQALHACGTPVPGNPACTVRYYNDIMLYYMIQVLASHQSVAEFLHPALLKIEAYDRDNNSDLMLTLKQYILNARNTSKTAKALNIHRNSLLYRLNRIRELTEIDLEDGNEFCKILIHIRIREYEHA